MKESGPILLVIDMQPNFVASNNIRLIANCAREIRRAIRAGNRIVFVEYLGEGKTHRPLVQLVHEYDDYDTELYRYPRYTVVGKTEDDGSAVIYEHLKTLKRRGPYTFTVIGVNTDACVRKTVLGLTKRRGTVINVIKNACNQPKTWINSPFGNMVGKRNVALV